MWAQKRATDYEDDDDDFGVGFGRCGIFHERYFPVGPGSMYTYMHELLGLSVCGVV